MNNLFGEALKKARIAAGFSGNKLAGKLGVSSAYISTLETGRSVPASREAILKISEILGSDAAILIKAKMEERGKHECRLYKNSEIAKKVQVLLTINDYCMDDDDFIFAMGKIGFFYDGECE